MKAFLDQLADDGYNRSSLMQRMMVILECVYYAYPSIPLPRGIQRLYELVQGGLLTREFTDGHLNQCMSSNEEHEL